MNTQNQIIYQVGEVSLSYKKKEQFLFHPIKSSEDLAKIIRQIIPESQINYREHFYAIYLTMRNEVIGYHLISVGGINHTMVDIRILLQGALLCNAVSICIFHNHPSTNINPSSADKTLTKKIAKACKVIDLTLLDHIIITENDYYSFADYGEL